MYLLQSNSQLKKNKANDLTLKLSMFSLHTHGSSVVHQFLSLSSLGKKCALVWDHSILSHCHQ